MGPLTGDQRLALRRLAAAEQEHACVREILDDLYGPTGTPAEVDAEFVPEQERRLAQLAVVIWNLQLRAQIEFWVPGDRAK